MKTIKTNEELHTDFKSAAEKLKKIAGNKNATVSEMNGIEADFGKAARALMQCSLDNNEFVINKLESDFGRTARALMQCSVDSNTTESIKNHLQNDFNKAALALMQCGVDLPTKTSTKEREDKLGEAVAKLFVDKKSRKNEVNLISDFSKTAKSVMQCSSEV